MGRDILGVRAPHDFQEDFSEPAAAEKGLSTQCYWRGVQAQDPGGVENGWEVAPLHLGSDATQVLLPLSLPSPPRPSAGSQPLCSV